MIYRCQNCGLSGDEEDFDEAKDLLLRMTPGDIFSDKECPRCGALAFPIEALETDESPYERLFEISTSFEVWGRGETLEEAAEHAVTGAIHQISTSDNLCWTVKDSFGDFETTVDRMGHLSENHS